MIKLNKQNKSFYSNDNGTVSVNFRKRTGYFTYTLTIEFLDIKEGFNTLKECKDFINNIPQFEEREQYFLKVKNFFESIKLYYSTRELKAMIQNKSIIEEKIFRQFQHGKIEEAKKMIEFFNIEDKQFFITSINELINMNKRDIERLKESKFEGGYYEINNILNHLQIDQYEKVYNELIKEIEKLSFEELKSRLLKIEGINPDSLTLENYNNTLNGVKEKIEKAKRCRKEDMIRYNYVEAFNGLYLFFHIVKVETIEAELEKEKKAYFERIELQRKRYNEEIEKYKNILTQIEVK